MRLLYHFFLYPDLKPDAQKVRWLWTILKSSFLYFTSSKCYDKQGEGMNGVHCCHAHVSSLTSFSCSVPKQSWIALSMAGRILLRWRVRESPATADSMASARVLTGGVMSWKAKGFTRITLLLNTSNQNWKQRVRTMVSIRLQITTQTSNSIC